MKSLFISSFIVFSMSISGQDCKYSKNEKDKFEGYYIKRTEYQTIYSSHTVEEGTLDISLSLSKFSKDNYEARSVSVYLKERRGSLYSSDNETTLIIMLSNDSIVRLKNTIDKLEFSDLGYVSVGGTSIAQHTKITSFDLNERAIQLLSNNKMVSLRIDYRDKRVTIDVPEKVKKKLGAIDISGEKGYNGQFYFMNYLKCID